MDVLKKLNRWRRGAMIRIALWGILKCKGPRLLEDHLRTHGYVCVSHDGGRTRVYIKGETKVYFRQVNQ